MLIILDMTIAIGLVSSVDVPGKAHSTPSDEFERSPILCLGKRKHLFFIRLPSSEIENGDDRVITDIHELEIVFRRVYRCIKSWSRDSGAIYFCIEEIVIIGRMSAIF